jgi:hypothetical protein
MNQDSEQPFFSQISWIMPRLFVHSGPQPGSSSTVPAPASIFAYRTDMNHLNIIGISLHVAPEIVSPATLLHPDRMQ